jgi:thioredoxin reductase
MTTNEISVYGAHWCPDCRDSKQFLGEHQIPYNWVDIEEDPAGEKFVIEKNDGKRIIPTIVFADGSITEVNEFIGRESKLTELKLFNNRTGDSEMFPINGAFIFIGLDPNTGFLAESRIALDSWGFVTTGHALLHRDHRPKGFEGRDPYLLETSVPGVFAAGDVRDTSTKQVVSAAGEGSTAALLIREYLKSV